MVAQILPPDPPLRGENALSEELPLEALPLQGKCSVMVLLGFMEEGASSSIAVESGEWIFCGAE